MYKISEKLEKLDSESQEAYQYRKIQPIDDGASFGIVLPKSYAVNMGLRKEGFV